MARLGRSEGAGLEAASERGQASAQSKTPAWRKALYWLFCGAVTVGLLAWSLRDLSLPALGQVLSRVNYGWLAVALGSYLVVFALRAWRWGLLLAAECWPGRWRDRFYAFFVGYAANSVLPASAGEVVRAVLLNRWAKVPVEPALGSVLGEKLMDVLVVFLILLALIARQPQLSGSLPLGLLGAVIGVSCAIFWLLARYPRAITQLAGRSMSFLGLGRWRSQVVHLLGGLLAGLSIFRQPGQFLITLGATFLSWAVNGITYWAVLLALGIIKPGWIGSLITQSLAAFAIALPSSPGFVGPFEAAVRFGLNLYQVDGAEAIAAALLLRLVMYVLTPMLGLLLALRLGLSRSDLNGLAPQAAAHEPSALAGAPVLLKAGQKLH